ncbi:histidine-specific methyltransferase [Mycena latifolia]|nr:histidine-specific methyltransferase [Mycena latifolia]
MPVQIIDLQTKFTADPAVDMSAQVLFGLRSQGSDGKNLPSMLLYDERGLRLFDDITMRCQEYYLFGAEEEILKTRADEIVAAMHKGTGGLVTNEILLELGAGALRKTSHILLALARLVTQKYADAPITYYALDLEKRELERTLGELSASDVGNSLQGKVDTRGLCATYEQGLKFAESGELRDTTVTNGHVSGSSANDILESAALASVHIMFLGSSLGNLPRADGAAFLRSLPLRPNSGDTLLIGLDHDNEESLIEAAYNDRHGCSRRFILNGLKGAGRALGDEKLFDEENWEHTNNYNSAERRHLACVKAKRAHTVVVPSTKEKINFLQGEKVKLMESVKFSESDAHTLFADGGLVPVQRWTNSSGLYSLWLVERPPVYSST